MESRTFPLGSTVITFNAQEQLHPEDVARCLAHALRVGLDGSCESDVERGMRVRREDQTSQWRVLAAIP